MIKIGHYFSTIDITKGLCIAILLSLFIYMEHYGYTYKIFVTIFGILGLYFILGSNQKVWFWSGFFTSIFWFWWIVLSFSIYGISWAMPIGIFGIGAIYGFIFLILYKLSYLLSSFSKTPLVIWLGICIFIVSYIHPFGFDWFKLQIIFFNSYLGTNWWQFIVVVASISFAHHFKNILYLIPLVFAYNPSYANVSIDLNNSIKIVTTNIPIEQKWGDDSTLPIFEQTLKTIDNAIKDGHELIIFPESTLGIFLNYEPSMLETIQSKSNDISIVMGALFWDDGVPRNSTYIFDSGNITVAHKYILVPFGEYNPLPKWVSNWANKIIHNGGIDYVAHSQMSDYTIGEITYRNAICYEATSKKLYKDKPKHMIAISNNGWFVPSTEPTLQRLLLQYYSRQFDTTIYHSINMSQSYIVKRGKAFFIE